MSRKLYIEEMLDLSSTQEKDPKLYPAGVIDIDCPITSVAPMKNNPEVGARMRIRALLDTDIKFSLSNKWGSLIDLGTELSDFQQLLNIGHHNLLQWISASSVGWKGSEPLRITFSCYLITYKSKQISIKDQAQSLVSLAALYVNTDGNPVMNQATVKVHGGYEPKVFVGNVDLLGDNTTMDTNLNTGKNNKLPSTSFRDMYTANGDNTGLIAIQWGGPDGPRISGLLLEQCEVEISAVQCAPGKPLWIKLTPTLRTFRSMTTKDVERIFGGKA